MNRSTVGSLSLAQEHRLAQLRDLGRQLGADRIAGSVKERDRAAHWDAELFRDLATAGLLAPMSPGFGGPATGALEALALFDGLGEGCADPGLATAVAVHAVLCTEPVRRLGTAAQRDRYLDRAAEGTWPAALPLREIDGGATVAADEDLMARRVDGGWVIDGMVRHVVNGPHARWALVTAGSPDGPHGGRRGARTAFLLDIDTPGVDVEPDENPPVGRTCPRATFRLTACRLPDEAVLGIVGLATEQLVPLVTALDRTIVSAIWLGVLRQLTSQSVRAAADNVLFGAPAARSQTVRASVVEFRTRVELSTGLLERAAWQLDHVDRPSRQCTAAAKLFLYRAVLDTVAEAAALIGLAGDDLVHRARRDAVLLAGGGGGEEALTSVVADAELRSVLSSARP